MLCAWSILSQGGQALEWGLNQDLTEAPTWAAGEGGEGSGGEGRAADQGEPGSHMHPLGGGGSSGSPTLSCRPERRGGEAGILPPLSHSSWGTLAGYPASLPPDKVQMRSTDVGGEKDADADSGEGLTR